MRWSQSIRYGVLLGALVLVLAACNGDEPELTTTSSLISSPSTDAVSPATTVAPQGGDTTTTSLVGQEVADYSIVARESDTTGETLFLVVPPGAYTDVDIENFVLDLMESEVATFGAEIFDDQTAVDAYRKPEAERTEAEITLISQHHLASLVNGTTIHFRGPLESSGELAIGS